MKTIGEFAAELYAAPAWLMVESVMIVAEKGEAIRVAPDDLERLPFPEGNFTLHVNIRSSALARSVDHEEPEAESS